MMFTKRVNNTKIGDDSMEINLNLTMGDIQKAEIVFLRNTYILSEFSNNFSYIVWYEV